MKPTLQLGIGQHLTMTPQLQQAIRLLQLSSLDLQQEIQAALDSNPMLETNEAESSDTAPEESNLDSPEEAYSNATESPEDRIIAEESFESQTSYKTKDTQYQKTGLEIERLSSEENSLQDHLTWQLQLTPLRDSDRLIATLIIDSINEDGYLESTLESIHQTVQKELDEESEIEDVEAVLQRIQLFDPIGVGARTLSECLKVQLLQYPKNLNWRDKALELVESYLPLLGKRDYQTLRRKLGVSLEELQEINHCIQLLHPKPGVLIGSTPSGYITPDVFVRKRQNKWVVDLNPECTPQLNINANYAALIRRADNSRDNQFLKGQLQEARWFLKSIENRNETLLKVAQCIVDEQDGFFELGEVAMKPLILHQVAEKVEMHESTISRVTTQKYMHTPRGTYELKYFFSSHVNTDSGGECSSTAIRAIIKQIIAEEDQKKPLSDLKLSQLLASKGIKVARRTVAKYREAMMIPPSNERKRLI